MMTLRFRSFFFTHYGFTGAAFLIMILAAACTGPAPEANTGASQTELEQLRAREKSLLRTNDSLLTLLAQQRPDAPVKAPAGSYILQDADLKRHQVPVAPFELAAYLQQHHASLIGAKGVLGGTMRFEEALPLAGRYVFASLSDGHIMAYGLYRYHTRKDGTLRWQRVYISPQGD